MHPHQSIQRVWQHVWSADQSIVRVAMLPMRLRIAIFAAAYGVFWGVGLVAEGEGLTAWRLFSLFIPIMAVVFWGGLVAIGLYLATLPLIYLLVQTKGDEFIGGVAGPLFALATLVVVAMLRHYVMQLHEAHGRIATLEGIIPICASCRKVRDDSGYWQQVEAYLAQRSAARFSHGLCPDCYAREMEAWRNQRAP